MDKYDFAPIFWSPLVDSDSSILFNSSHQHSKLAKIGEGLELTGLLTFLPPGNASGGYGNAAISEALRIGKRVTVGLLMILSCLSSKINRTRLK